MSDDRELIRRYVEATSSADGDSASALVADDVVIELPDGQTLTGKDGARQFAAKHAEADGRKQDVELRSIEPRAANQFVATLAMTGRETSTGEILYAMDVGGIFYTRDGLITRSRAFPSPEEAAAAADGT
jgi:ketosteroid isomerase-like protein